MVRFQLRTNMGALLGQARVTIDPVGALVVLVQVELDAAWRFLTDFVSRVRAVAHTLLFN